MDDQTPQDGTKPAESVPGLSERPDPRLTRHAACGKTWLQRGNRTGHCGRCHETFEGLAVFDAHWYSRPDGVRDCRPAPEVKINGVPLELIDGTWRGPRMSEDALARRKKQS